MESEPVVSEERFDLRFTDANEGRRVRQRPHPIFVDALHPGGSRASKQQFRKKHLPRSSRLLSPRELSPLGPVPCQQSLSRHTGHMLLWSGMPALLFRGSGE